MVRQAAGGRESGLLGPVTPSPPMASYAPAMAAGEIWLVNNLE
jgi:hypothetical protein